MEDLAAAAAGGTTGLYDAVLASEVLEHVARPHAFVGVLASLLAPVGWRGEGGEVWGQMGRVGFVPSWDAGTTAGWVGRRAAVTR